MMPTLYIKTKKRSKRLKLKELRAMRKNNQKSLISVHFVCVQAAGSLGCSLAITTSLSIYI